jgi:uncharacterized membrane protein
MNRQKMVLAATIFLIAGVSWIVSSWNGNAGFAVAHPVAGSKFSLDVAVTGWPALGGVTLTVLGVALLLVCAVLSVVDIATARRA